MTLPKSVNILGIDYEVVECETVDKFDPAFGQIDYANQTIKIDSTLTEQRKGVVFMHELLHGVFDGLGMRDFNENEGAVQSLAAALYCVLSSQPISFS